MNSEERLQREYSDQGFWQKTKKVGRKAGRVVMSPALKLYYVVRADNVPVIAKARAMAALGYFILPFDVIPDLLPVVGLTDDVTVMLVAIAALARYIDSDIEKKAKEKLDAWLGAPRKTPAA